MQKNVKVKKSNMRRLEQRNKKSEVWRPPPSSLIRVNKLTTFDFVITLTVVLRNSFSVSPSSNYPSWPSPPPIIIVTVKS